MCLRNESSFHLLFWLSFARVYCDLRFHCRTSSKCLSVLTRNYRGISAVSVAVSVSSLRQLPHQFIIHLTSAPPWFDNYLSRYYTIVFKVIQICSWGAQVRTT